MKRVVGFFTRLSEDYLPDAFVFSLVLTLVVFSFGLLFTASGPLELIEHWGKDFWSLNGFSMQMVFVLLTGSVLARAPIFVRGLEALSAKVRGERSALLTLIFFSLFTCWINWGFGLIVSGILAVELARKLGRVNFPLLIATAYSGFLVWHGGLSGSIPLKVAGNDEILQKIYPGLSIPLSETLFSSGNLLILGSIILTLPILILSFRGGEVRSFNVPAKPAPQMSQTTKGGPRAWLEETRALNLLFFGLFLVNLFLSFGEGGLDINRVNFIFLFAGLFLHPSPRSFLTAVTDSIGSCAGIVIQFPLYAGIMGIMQHSGLAEVIAELFVSLSTAKSLPFFTFLAGGIVNFFVPSGGGQWVVQGPVMLKAALSLGVDPRKIIIALSWGDAWTNMIQPFWAVPILGMAGLGLKEIMGYLLIVLFWSGILIGGLSFLL